MLERAIDFGAAPIDLKPIDEAILAAVLVRASDLAATGHQDMLFCELDADLQPWDRKGQSRSPLAEWFIAAGLTVLPSFKIPR